MEIPDHGWDQSLPIFIFFLIILLIILGLGLTNRIFLKMGLSNIGRRKTHTFIVIIGLLIGTAMISGALVVRDSMNYTFRKGTYETTTYLDETVSAPGNFFFNQSLFTSISDADPVDRLTDDLSPLVLFQGVSVYNTRTERTKPGSMMVGFDPELDKGFGKFSITKGSVDKYGFNLGADEAIINQYLADELKAKTGDTVEIYYTIPNKALFDLAFTSEIYSRISPNLQSLPDSQNIQNSTAPTTQPNTTLNQTAQSFTQGMPRINILTAEFTIKSITSNEGKAWMFGTPNIFINIDSARKMYNASQDEINFIKISNNGGVVDSVDSTDDVAKAVIDVLRTRQREANETITKEIQLAIINNKPIDLDNISWDDKIIFSINITKYKQAQIELADFATDSFGIFLLMMSMFTVATGILLIINIFVMLAEERRHELGISRALGLKTGHLTRMFLYEGVGYIIPASILGTFAGLLVAFGLIYGMNQAIGLDISSGIPLYFYPSSLVLAFSLGALISIGSIIFISNKLSKLNIVRSIREIPEPVYARGTTAGFRNGAILLIFGILGTFLGFQTNLGSLQILGPTSMIIGSALFARRYARQELVYTITGALIFFYTLWGIFYLPGGSEEEGMVMLVVIGLTLCFSAVMVLVFNSKALVSGIGRLLSFKPTLKATSEPAIGYSLEKRFRTGMTIAMFTLILFMVTLFSIFSYSFIVPDVENAGGGYDIIGRTSLGVDDLNNVSIQTDSGQVNLDPINLENDIEYFNAINSFMFWGNFKKDGETIPVYGAPYYGVYGVDEEFIEHMGWSLERIHPDFNDSMEVWQALMTNESYVIIDVSSASTNIPIQMDDWISLPDDVPGQRKEFKVIGILEETLLTGIFVNKNFMSKNFPQAQGSNIFLLKVKPGVSISEACNHLDTDFRIIGMQADSIKQMLIDQGQMMREMMRMFNLYLALGLLIGVVSLAVLAYRAVIERRRSIGVMRAIGYRKKMILGSFLFEILFITTLGIGLGLLVGFATAYGIWWTAMRELDVPFVFPWELLTQIIITVYIAAVVFTIIPAYKASKIPPAEAIRLIE